MIRSTEETCNSAGASEWGGGRSEETNKYLGTHQLGAVQLAADISVDE